MFCQAVLAFETRQKRLVYFLLFPCAHDKCNTERQGNAMCLREYLFIFLSSCAILVFIRGGGINPSNNHKGGNMSFHLSMRFKHWFYHPAVIFFTWRGTRRIECVFGSIYTKPWKYIFTVWYMDFIGCVFGVRCTKLSFGMFGLLFGKCRNGPVLLWHSVVATATYFHRFCDRLGTVCVIFSVFGVSYLANATERSDRNVVISCHHPFFPCLCHCII